MANTILTAKNTFEEALVMDFSPDNTLSNCLTSALNATLITFNGNEMALLNDMGNGRVETAYLPEGYVPVGTCEFGDIIYVVSYNPLINKSLIGCFPSPERNISSDETGGMNLSLSWTDFLEGDSKPNGELKTTSVKKIIYDNGMNPGDKYIISANNLSSNSSLLSDYGNTSHVYGAFPKFTKIHVISIEDSGKINYLDSSVKWYNDYYIYNNLNPTFDITDADLDLYRDLVKSEYSIFQSKVKGKLALLIELERINSFNASYTVYTLDKKNNTQDYKVCFNVSWEGNDPNINPSEIVVTKGEWTKIEKEGIPYTTMDETKKEQKTAYYNPISSESKPELHIGALLSRVYKPEEGCTYEEFIKNYEYNKYTKDLVKSIRNKNDDPNSYPTTLTLDILKVLNLDGNSEIGILKVLNLDGDLDENLDENPETPKGNSYYINVKSFQDGKYKYSLSNGELIDCPYLQISDDIVNNFFKKEVTKLVLEENIPVSVQIDNTLYYNDLSNFIWNYELAPAMPYGILRDLTVKGTIDFSKIGTGLINLSEWRYYNDGNTSTLKWGLEAYPETNKAITKVAFRFFDNQGIAAVYNIIGKASYSGSFTEAILLGTESSNLNMSSTDIDGTIGKHKGDGPYSIDESASNADKETFKELIAEGVYIEEDGEYYVNDFGTLYPNILYLVEINIYYGTIDNLGNLSETVEPIKFKRWYWTNTLMNDYYYNTVDFVGVIPSLELKLDSQFISNAEFIAPIPETDPSKYVIDNSEITSEEIEKIEEIKKSLEIEESEKDNIITKVTLGGMVLKIGTKTPDVSNLSLNIVPGLENNHNTFAFDEATLNQLNYNIYFANLDIIYTDFNVILDNQTVGIKDFLKPKIEDKTELSDYFSIIPKVPNVTSEDINYYSPDSDEIINATKVPKCTINARNSVVYGDTIGIPLLLEGQMVSKIAATNLLKQSGDFIVYKPIITTKEEDLNKYNIGISSLAFYFKQCPILGSDGDKVPYLVTGIANSSTSGYGELTMPGRENTSLEFKGLNLDIGNILKESDIDVGLFGLVTFITYQDEIDDRGGSRNERCDGFVLLRENNNSYKKLNLKYRTLWFKNIPRDEQGHLHELFEYTIRRPMKDKEYKDYKDGGGPLKWESEDCSVNAAGGLIAKLSSGNYILFNNFCTFKPKAGTVDLQFCLDYKKASTYAQLIFSVLAKLYYKTSNTIKMEVPVLTNISTCSDYTETWKKDIVVETVFLGTNSNSLLSMSGLNLAEYISQIKTNYGNPTIDDNINIDFKLDKVLCIQFLYSLPYNIEYLEDIYRQPIQYYIEPDVTEEYKGGTTKLPPFLKNLGVINSDNKLVDLESKYNSFKVLKISGSKITEDPDNIITISSDILQAFTLKEDTIYIGNINNNLNHKLVLIGGNSEDKYRNRSPHIRIGNKTVFFDHSELKPIP